MKSNAWMLVLSDDESFTNGPKWFFHTTQEMETALKEIKRFGKPGKYTLYRVEQEEKFSVRSSR